MLQAVVFMVSLVQIGLDFAHVGFTREEGKEIVQ